jgi:heme exporter protein C
LPPASTRPEPKASLHRFANPARFLRIADAVLPWASGLSAFAFVAGLYLALFASPPDYQQGETVRIMYVHVPSAWMALFVYTSMAVASAAALIWKHPLADVIAKSCAPLGAGFTVVALATGALWGQPMWGTWWVWDARLTSVLILLFLYLGYIALVNAFDDPGRGAKAAAILALVGFVNVPIIKFSVDWWNTLHQPASVARFGAPAIHTSMLIPLLVMAAAFKLFFVAVLILRVRAELAARKVRAIRMARLHAQDRVDMPHPLSAREAT